jgi:gluconate 2-dehydrogenase gamma chain
MAAPPMNDNSKLSRREFMRRAALGAGTLTLIGGCATPDRSNRKFLSDDEAGLMEAIAEQIIPAGEWPGGRDAGVVTFIDRQLAGPYRRFQEDYRKGLAAITDKCLKQYRKKFELLSPEQQTALLKDMESGKFEDGVWGKGFGRRFFEMLRSHSLQGYYGSPRHGGNKNYVSYAMIGLDYPPVIGQNRYRS